MTFPGVAARAAEDGSGWTARRSTHSSRRPRRPIVALGDTYWLGKQLGKWATLLPIAEELGDAAAEELTRRIKAALENWFTATDASGAPKAEDLFYYDRTGGRSSATRRASARTWS